MNDIARQLCEITVPADWIYENAPWLPALFDGVVIVKAEFNFARQSFDYVGFHRVFPALPRDFTPPKASSRISWIADEERYGCEWHAFGAAGEHELCNVMVYDETRRMMVAREPRRAPAP